LTEILKILSGFKVMSVNLSKGITRYLIFKRVSFSKEQLSGKTGVTINIHGISAEEKSKPKNDLIYQLILYV